MYELFPYISISYGSWHFRLAPFAFVSIHNHIFKIRSHVFHVKYKNELVEINEIKNKTK